MTFGAAGVALTLLLFTLVEREGGRRQKRVYDALEPCAVIAQEEGLRVCFANKDVLPGEAVWKAFSSLTDRLSGTDNGYPISTGRYITTRVQNYPNFYAPIWEYTVTGYCDAFLAGGNPGLGIYILSLAALTGWTTLKMITARSVMARSLFGLLFYHLFVIYNGGNVAAQLLGLVGQSWLLVFGVVAALRCVAYFRRKGPKKVFNQVRHLSGPVRRGVSTKETVLGSHPPSATRR